MKFIFDFKPEITGKLQSLGAGSFKTDRIDRPA
jgi:hypothetical protein